MIFASIEREDARPACPYLLGIEPRTCITGCWQEPRCITDAPLNGWTEPPVHPVNRVLIAYRLCDEHERVEFATELNTLWLDLYLGSLSPEFTVEVTGQEIDHAMNVIRRHQRMLS